MAQPQVERSTVLLVDDEEQFRASVVRLLDDERYRCFEAASAVEALAHLDAVPETAAVLCDVQLGNESGLDVLASVVADYPDVAVVMATGVDDPEIGEQAFRQGAWGYLLKPFSRNQLRITLAGAVHHHESVRARREQTQEPERVVSRAVALNSLLAQIGGVTWTTIDPRETIERLTAAITLRDEETGRHLERMSRYAAVLAEAVGISSQAADRLRIATALHDVGKIGIPDAVLLKPASLTDAERAVMQRHSRIGYQLLAPSATEVLALAATIALNHHEWWDGGGYPQGLRGESIPIEARIASVADVFDALTSRRVYRAALARDEAIAMMTEASGRQFEPRLLDAFIELADDLRAIRDAFPDIDDQDRVRVLVVDDHEIFAQSVVRLLGAQADIKVVGVAGTVADACAATVASTPDVVLLDWELPDGTGAKATTAIRALRPDAKVVILTGRGDSEVLEQAIAAGCAGFVTKTDTVERLVDAIAAAHAGEAPQAHDATLRLLGRLTPTHRRLGADLGRRECEVLELIVDGRSNKEIAAQMHLSVNTVRNHVQNILYKLDAHSKLEASSIAVREGLVDLARRSAGA